MNNHARAIHGKSDDCYTLQSDLHIQSQSESNFLTNSMTLSRGQYSHFGSSTLVDTEERQTNISPKSSTKT